MIDGKIKPSTKLLDVVAEAIQSNFEWRLLDEQLLVFNTIVSKVDQYGNDQKKSIVIIRGGPGTGKSVLAIQLLAYAARKNWRVAYSIGSKAFITTMQALTEYFADEFLKKIHSVKHKKHLPVKELFVKPAEIAKIGSNDENVFDIVVNDEAHRLWDFRRQVYSNINKKLSDTPMIEEIISASKVNAFFLDDNQSVRSNEIGSVEFIKNQAKKLDVNVDFIDLNTQFRCSGSEAYIKWVDYILGFCEKNSKNWQRYESYDFKIFDTIEELQHRLDVLKESGNKCRLVAGFCWKWHPKMAGIHHDIKDNRFGKWSAPWIENTNQASSKNVLTHPYYRWANDEEYYSQVGSIYSVQGFEFDYIGLIFGEDLIRRNNTWEINLEKNKDSAFKRNIKNDEEAKEKLKNIYRVLLTRGMKGTYVYFLDNETKLHFTQVLSD